MNNGCSPQVCSRLIHKLFAEGGQKHCIDVYAKSEGLYGFTIILSRIYDIWICFGQKNNLLNLVWEKKHLLPATLFHDMINVHIARKFGHILVWLDPTKRSVQRSASQTEGNL